LKGEAGQSVRDVIKQLCEWKKVEILEGSVQEDHLHLVLSFTPKYSISEVVGFLKGKSTIKVFDIIFDINSELKKRYWGRHFWARGYCASTIGLDEEQIRKYVRWQLKKDRTMDQLKLWEK
jgi:putative transposase